MSNSGDERGRRASAMVGPGSGAGSGVLVRLSRWDSLVRSGMTCEVRAIGARRFGRGSATVSDLALTRLEPRLRRAASDVSPYVKKSAANPDRLESWSRSAKKTDPSQSIILNQQNLSESEIK